MDRKVRKKAQELMDNGQLYELYALIGPHLQKDDPVAQYLHSCFSLVEWEESEEEFEARMVKLTTQAAKARVPEALRKLSSWHYNGEFVAKDRAKAARLMLEAEAIEAEHQNPSNPT